MTTAAKQIVAPIDVKSSGTDVTYSVVRHKPFHQAVWAAVAYGRRVVVRPAGAAIIVAAYAAVTACLVWLG